MEQHSAGYVIVDGAIVELTGDQATIEDTARKDPPEGLGGATIYWDRAMAENTIAYGDAVTARQVEARETLGAAGLSERELNLFQFGTPHVPNLELSRALDRINDHVTPPWLEETE